MKKTLIIAIAIFAPAISNADESKFNIACSATKVELKGTDTWGENLYSKEREDAWLSEKVEFAIDLVGKNYCIAKYCTPETYGGPEKIAKIEGKRLIFGVYAKKVHESNDYNVISSDSIFDQSKMTFTDHYKYYEENGDKVLGDQIITYSCEKTAYRIHSE